MRSLPWLGLIAFFAAFATVTQADPDLWGHVKFGLDTLTARSLGSVDPYSFTQDRPWLNHEWLSELLMGAAYKLGGIRGLIWLKAALVIGVFLIVWRSLAGAALWVRIAASVWLAVGAAHMNSTVRPQLWSFLGVAIVCRILSADSKAVAWLPLVFAIWANMHGGWIVGVGVVAAWGAISAVVRREQYVRYLGLPVLCVVATLATPYGLDLWHFIWGTVHLERDILEWRPLTESVGPQEWLPWAVTVLLGALVNLDRRPIDLPRIAVLLILAIASFRVMRIVSLFIAASLILIGPALARRWPLSRKAPAAPPLPKRLAAALAAIPAIAGVVAAVLVARQTTSCISVRGDWAVELPAWEVVRSSGARRLVTHFNWGQYVIWHAGPGMQVSIDGRRETVYTDRHLSLHREVERGSEAGQRALLEWQPDVVWLPKTSGVKAWLMERGYRLLYDSPWSYVLAAPNLAEAGPIFEHRPEFPQRCFPL